MDDLGEIEAIRRLKHRYMRCLDEKRWDELRECFTDDATCAYGGGRYAFAGRDAILAFLARAMGRETFRSSHRATQPEIDLTSATTATGVWALDDTVVDEAGGRLLRGAAFYRDEYVKVDGAWRIRHTGYDRVFELVEPLGARGRRMSPPARRPRGTRQGRRAPSRAARTPK